MMPGFYDAVSGGADGSGDLKSAKGQILNLCSFAVLLEAPSTSNIPTEETTSGET